MLIFSRNVAHDGATAIIEDGRLIASVEAEKNNRRRHSRLTDDRLIDAIAYLPRYPDVIAEGGWFPPPAEWQRRNKGAYFGEDESAIVSTRARRSDHNVWHFATSHERAHIFCAYGLSPFEHGRPCYALVWEGTIGAIYSVDHNCQITRLHSPMTEPGHRYAFLYELANKDFGPESRGLSMDSAGKLMALACAPSEHRLSEDEHELLEALLGDFDTRRHTKADFSHFPLSNIGVVTDRFRRFAHAFSEAMYDRFYAAAKEVIKDRRPLLIAGGCGLNCTWNTHWLNSGLFADVFVPPCTDDSGAAIGAAVDAQRQYVGNAKVEWTVYCGEPFEEDIDVTDGFVREDLDYDRVAEMLRGGAVIAWVQGRYELGPRALGNRSLLAAPFSAETKNRLNAIKKREPYRPVAPVCAEEQVSRWFDPPHISPYMLHFQQVRTNLLQAITHDDGTARAQTVTATQNAALHRLLMAFERLTGAAVLCNTSLNYPGHGFINSLSTLVSYANERHIDGFVVNDRCYVRRA